MLKTEIEAIAKASLLEQINKDLAKKDPDEPEEETIGKLLESANENTKELHRE